VALTNQELIQELKHEIHSPLAAIRNALYLAGCRMVDPEALRYLKLADAEISHIAAVLNNANQIDGNRQVQYPDSIHGCSFRSVRFTIPEQQITISSLFVHSLCCI
jgi:nitrogen-specific signal transduction histidine kinase